MDTIITIVIYFCLLCCGFFIGWLVRKKPKVDGLLGVDTRDPDKDFYDFVFLIPTDDIQKKKYLNIEVKVK